MIFRTLPANLSVFFFFPTVSSCTFYSTGLLAVPQFPSSCTLYYLHLSHVALPIILGIFISLLLLIICELLRVDMMFYSSLIPLDRIMSLT